VKELREQTGAGMMDCKRALTDTDGDLEAATDWLRKKGLAAAAKKAGRATSEGLVGLVVSGNVGSVIEVNCETDFVARNDAFQELVRDIAELAPAAGNDVSALAASVIARTGRTVADEITHAVSVIGENIALRRVATIEVESGIVAGYVHGQVAPGLGRIGVLVGLRSAGDPERLAEPGKQLAMHVAASRPSAVTVEGLDPALVARERSIYADQARATGKPDAIIEKIVDGRMRKFHEESVLLEQAFVVDPDLRVREAVEKVAKEIGQPVEITEFVRCERGEGIDVEKKDLASEIAELAPQ
jgi:elongation factor Ts